MTCVALSSEYNGSGGVYLYSRQWWSLMVALEILIFLQRLSQLIVILTNLPPHPHYLTIFYYSFQSYLLARGRYHTHSQNKGRPRFRKWRRCFMNSLEWCISVIGSYTVDVVSLSKVCLKYLDWTYKGPIKINASWLLTTMTELYWVTDLKSDKNLPVLVPLWCHYGAYHVPLCVHR